MGEGDGFPKTDPAPATSVEHDGSLVELVLTEHAERGTEPAAGAPAPARRSRIDGVVVGVLAGFGAGGEPLVHFELNPAEEPLPARSAVAVADDAVGRPVALMFEGGDAARPMLIGLIHVPEAAPEAPEAEPVGGVEVEADGEKVVVSAERELVLRCGKASITLTRAGKILIRGEYVLTRSSGVNRIQGGSVEIN